MIKSSNNRTHNLYTLSLIQVLERFSFYGLLALLIVYMSQTRGFSDSITYELFGNFIAMAYTISLVGGWVADNYWGYKKCIATGLILIGIGEIILPYTGTGAIYFALAIIACGVGFYEPNMSSFVGSLYLKKKSSSTSGYTYLYMAINLGSLLGILLCSSLFQYFGSSYGFFTCSIVAFLGFGILLIWKEPFQAIVNPKNIFQTHTIPYVLLVLTIIMTILLLKSSLFIGLLLLTIIVPNFFFLRNSLNHSKQKNYKLALFMILFVLIFNMIFIMLFMQSKSSLTLFALRDINRSIFDFIIPAPTLQILSPLFVLLLGQLMIRMWNTLSKENIKLNVPLNYGIGLLLASIAFSVLVFSRAHYSHLEPLFILVISYLFLTLAELFISPVGLSTILQYAPKNKLSLMMGIWNLSYAMANYLSAKMAALSSISHLQTLNYQKANYFYQHEFYISFIIGIVASVLCFSVLFSKYKNSVN